MAGVERKRTPGLQPTGARFRSIPATGIPEISDELTKWNIHPTSTDYVSTCGECITRDLKPSIHRLGKDLCMGHFDLLPTGTGLTRLVLPAKERSSVE